MNSIEKTNTKSLAQSGISEKIALNFFPLNDQGFSFKIFRRCFDNNDNSDMFPGCSRRRLPIKSDFDELREFNDYWVSIESGNNFEEFTCQALDNIYLTKDMLFHSLLEKCKNTLIKECDYVVISSFRPKQIFFILETFPEGKRTVWLEPYFLKSGGTFGFLVDFKFLTPRGTESSRRIQQLSLSLDKDGRSNKNFYLDRFEQLQRFLKKYYNLIFPIKICSNNLYMEKVLYNSAVGRLNPKQYIFSNERTSTSQFTGVKSYGPLTAVLDNPKVYFLFQQNDKPFADELFKALRGDTYKTTFPGMEEMFKFKFDKENVGGKEISGYDDVSLNETIRIIINDANGRKVIPLLLFPYKKDGGKDATRMYHLAKYIFLKNKLPSQFVSISQMRLRDQLKWSVSNIGLALFAKMGGEPWKVKPSSDNSLIIGLGQAHKKVNNTIVKYFAYSVLTESTGLYKDLKILGQNTSKTSYLSELKSNLRSIFDKYFDYYNTFVIHSTFSIPHEELKVVEELLENFKSKQNCSKKFVVMKFNDKNKYFGYSVSSNSKIPYESSYIRLSQNDYLVWFEGLQYHNPNVLKKIERPLRAPVKSHTLTGSCRTVGTEKYWQKLL